MADETVSHWSAGSGLLAEDARRTSIEHCLPLLATYFSSAESWELSLQSAVSDADDSLDRDLERALRLRVLLALAEELIRIVQPIMAKPTFRYSQIAEESAGLVTGRLDVPRYTARRGRRTAPKLYPIRVVQRELATPENVLAVCALDAVKAALAAVSISSLPEAGPERRELLRIQADVQRFRRLPLASSLARTAARITQSRGLDQQRRLVQRRIERGDIRRPEPYLRLSRWVSQFLTGAGIRPDTRLWAFYDSRFDPRLFEILTLSFIADGLCEQFGSPDDGGLAPLWRRQEGPIGSWTSPYGRVELYFQRESASMGLTGRWQILEGGRRLRAIPDIAIRVTYPDGSHSWLLVECKLKSRKPLPGASADSMGDKDGASRLDLPTDELYKLLGYFDHLLADVPPQGALVYYTPGGSASLQLGASRPDSEDGSASLIGVDPADEIGSRYALRWIALAAKAMVGSVDAGTEQEARAAADRARSAGLDEVEVQLAFKQRLLVELVRSYAKAHEEQLPAIQKLTASWFTPSTWNALDEDTRRMVLSAELYGSRQLEELDHSGPLLVLCAACERELNRRLFARVAERFPGAKDQESPHPLDRHATLGAAVEVLHRGRRLAHFLAEGIPDAEQRALGTMHNPDQLSAARLTGQYLAESSAGLNRIAALVKGLRVLNVKYRRPAAHDQIVEIETWRSGRGMILGTAGLLSQIVEVLAEQETDGEIEEGQY